MVSPQQLVCEVCLDGQRRRAGLRKMLVELLGIRSWLELSFGTSRKAYNGMDTYVSMWHHGMEPPAN